MRYNEYQSVVGEKTGFLKLKEGENRIRLVSEAEPFESEFNGSITTRFVAYVIDRSDGKVKPFTFGSQILGGIGQLATSTEYGFTDLPPYDIVISRKGTGIETEYVVQAARKDTALTEEEQAEVKNLDIISSLAAKLTAKVKGEPKIVSEEEIPVINEDEVRPGKDMPF